MEQIKTIIESYPAKFDEQVNNALRAGWQLLNRQVLPGADGIAFYAELNKYDGTETDERTEADEPNEDDTAEWQVTRDPAHPLRCSKCGNIEVFPRRVCLDCGRVMVNGQ